MPSVSSYDYLIIKFNEDIREFSLFTYLPGWHLHIITVVLKRVIMNGDNHLPHQTPELTRHLQWTLNLDMVPLMFSRNASKHTQCWKEAAFGASPT